VRRHAAARTYGAALNSLGVPGELCKESRDSRRRAHAVTRLTSPQRHRVVLGGDDVDRLSSKDLWSGLMFAGFGALALYMGSNLSLGTAVRMGPGYVPRMLSYILIGLGVAIIVRAVIAPGDAIERFRWKPTTMITIGVIVFALLFERAGLAPALVCLIFLAALGGQEFKLVETIISCTVLTALCIVIFKLGLGMNISIIRGVW
jgi:hypothetical protein